MEMRLKSLSLKNSWRITVRLYLCCKRASSMADIRRFNVYSAALEM
jgi:hypothetical protein